MTTPASTISSSQVNTENNKTSSATMSFEDADVRALAGITAPGTAISLADLRGKNRIYTTASPILNLNVYNTLLAGGWDGITAVKYVIPAGIYIWSDNNALPALTTGGPFPAGLTLTNNGYIMGKGGKGGYSGVSPVGTQPPAIYPLVGGSAVSIDSALVTLINNAGAWIGGGGGGGGGGLAPPSQRFYGGGGGAGGGDGGGPTGAAAVTIGNAATNGQAGSTGYSGSNAGGGSGTRRFVLGEMAGGGGGYPGFPGGYMASGGTNNNVGANGQQQTNPAPIRSGAGGGGGWGASGGTGGHNSVPQAATPNMPGAVGGKAIALNGQTLTQSNSGTIWGAIS